MVSDLWNSSKNKKAVLEPKDVDQGLDWELIFRSSIYLGRKIVPEDLIFDLVLEKIWDIKAILAMTGKEEIRSIYKEKTNMIVLRYQHRIVLR